MEGIGLTGQPVLDVLIPLAGRRSLRIHLYRYEPGLPFWLRHETVAMHYCLDTSGRDPFQDADLRRFLLALGAQFRAGLRLRDPEWIEARLREVGLPARD